MRVGIIVAGIFSVAAGAVLRYAVFAPNQHVNVAEVGLALIWFGAFLIVLGIAVAVVEAMQQAKRRESRDRLRESQARVNLAQADRIDRDSAVYRPVVRGEIERQEEEAHYPPSRPR